jgi:hypothetical protein
MRGGAVTTVTTGAAAANEGGHSLLGETMARPERCDAAATIASRNRAVMTGRAAAGVLALAVGVAALAAGVLALTAGVLALAGDATDAGVATLGSTVLGDAERGVVTLGDADRESTSIGEADREADAGTLGEADRGVAFGVATGLGVGAAANAAIASGVILGVAGVPFCFDPLDAADMGVDGATGVD